MNIRTASQGTRFSVLADRSKGRRAITTRLTAVVVALGLMIAGTSLAVPAWADDYPTWADVEAARGNEAAAADAVSKIKSLIAGLQEQVASTRADAEAKANAWQDADTKYQAASEAADTLQRQADAANAKAATSDQRAGQIAAQLVRAGGEDVTANLLMSTGGNSDFLNNIGMSRKVSEQAYAIYERATLDRNTAQSLTDQADVAKTQLEGLRKAAEAAFVAAQAASEAASAALAAQVSHQAELEAQLNLLMGKTAATEKDYLAGVAARAAAAAAQAALDAAAAPPSLGAGEISLSGWARPAGGYISAGYGYSADYGTKFHKGTDLAAGCGSDIYAASSGRVIFASYGWNGGYGNEIIIDHGNGVMTRYGHIVAGGIYVGTGQSVGVGNNIASVGSTGDSTGCHLHFEVLINWDTTDPVSFMADQGIYL